MKEQPKTSTVAGGRVAVYCPDHPKANNRGYIPRARWVAEQHLGRRLHPREDVHHINGDKTDDEWENLEVLSVNQHARLHDNLSGFRDSSGYCDNDESIKTKYLEGLGYKKISEILKIPRTTVRDAVHRMVRQGCIKKEDFRGRKF